MRKVLLPLPGLLALVLALPSAEPPFYKDKADLRYYLDGDKRVPVESAADWRKRREHVLANVQLVTGSLPLDSRKVALDVKVEGEEKLPGVVRKKITFAAEKGDRVSAYLLIPRDLKGKAPAVL